MPSSASLAFSPNGSQFDLFAVSASDVLYRYNQNGSGFTPLMGGVLSVSVAYNPLGAEEIDVVMKDGSVVAYGAPVGGVQTVLPSGYGVAAVSVAFAPNGDRVRELTLQNGDLYQQNTNGKFGLLTSGVRSASVAFATNGAEVLDVVGVDGSVDRYGDSGGVPSQPTISTGVSAESLTFAPNGTLIQTAVQEDVFVTPDVLTVGNPPPPPPPPHDLVIVAIGSSPPVTLGELS
ncbi:WD40 repeat domain-containing protein [Frigoriglobus tundricola]|uniref:WD40 repeat domain-containing protein n=1 Tax=Frigoriglobus tundricola TaxID=2774151 RepID=UPI00148E9793|nr:WD40 repeat domain-containing protein [Frigoriglobus tundricola]